ncbi:MAG: class I SAM-dependent methyltransferase [bacterium]|nr:class I SAM-dependent methyltransferase [bacterium]
MKSKYVDKFQHDSCTEEYDSWVKNESNPMRTGYKQTLEWVANISNAHNPKNILEMGSGTGALTQLLKNYETLVCVDASIEMIKKAKSKSFNLDKIHYKLCDFLEYFDSNTTKVEMLVSTYALHHLTENEKELFFQKAISILAPNGHIVIGDIMFLDQEKKKNIVQIYKTDDQNNVLELIKTQYFWDISRAKKTLLKLGFSCREFQLSQLSWGLDCFKA